MILIKERAHDLQALLVFSQHPMGISCAGKPLESVVCRFNLRHGLR